MFFDVSKIGDFRDKELSKMPIVSSDFSQKILQN